MSLFVFVSRIVIAFKKGGQNESEDKILKEENKMRWTYLIWACALIVGIAIGLIVRKNRRSRFSQKQLEIKRRSFEYAFIAVFIFEAFLMALHSFNVEIPFYWLTLGPLFIAVIVAEIYDLIHRVYLPINPRIKGSGWAWTFIVIGILLIIPSVLKIFDHSFNSNMLVNLLLAIVIIGYGIGILQARKS